MTRRTTSEDYDYARIRVVLPETGKTTTISLQRWEHMQALRATRTTPAGFAALCRKAALTVPRDGWGWSKRVIEKALELGQEACPA